VDIPSTGTVLSIDSEVVTLAVSAVVSEAHVEALLSVRDGARLNPSEAMPEHLLFRLLLQLDPQIFGLVLILAPQQTVLNSLDVKDLIVDCIIELQPDFLELIRLVIQSEPLDHVLLLDEQELLLPGPRQVGFLELDEQLMDGFTHLSAVLPLDRNLSLLGVHSEAELLPLELTGGELL